MEEGKGGQSWEAMTATQALLGKRPRQCMRRSTSMTEFSFEYLTAPAAAKDAGGPACHPDHRFHQRESQSASTSRGSQRRSFGDFGELDTTALCGFCSRRLGPGCDNCDNFIYSLVCRHQKMNQDEQRTGATSASTPAAAATESSGTAQTTAAA